MPLDPERRGIFIAELTDIWNTCLINAVNADDAKAAMALTIALSVLEETYVPNQETTGFIFVGER